MTDQTSPSRRRAARLAAFALAAALPLALAGCSEEQPRSGDGKASGQTPTELAVPTGAHKIVLSHGGFEPVTTSSLVEAGQT